MRRRLAGLSRLTRLAALTALAGLALLPALSLSTNHLPARTWARTGLVHAGNERTAVQRDDVEEAIIFGRLIIEAARRWRAAIPSRPRKTIPFLGGWRSTGVLAGLIEAAAVHHHVA